MVGPSPPTPPPSTRVLWARSLKLDTELELCACVLPSTSTHTIMQKSSQSHPKGTLGAVHGRAHTCVAGYKTPSWTGHTPLCVANQIKSNLEGALGEELELDMELELRGPWGWVGLDTHVLLSRVGT